MQNTQYVGQAVQTPLDIDGLKEMAALIRCDLLEMIHKAGEGHPGGSLSAADIVTALYFRIMAINPDAPDWEDRDRFVLSKGHACPVWYAALTRRGFLGCECNGSLRCIESVLQGHPDMNKTTGVEFTAGSLGHGFSAALGMALASKHLGMSNRIWAIIGDGEMQEGSVWEAALAGPKFGLDNLTVILDRNHIQNDDFVAKIMPMEPVVDKWKAFNWHVIEIDGHDMAQVVEALDASRDVKNKPTMIVAETIKGKGVSFMEHNPAWHGRAPNDEELTQALQEIGSAAGWEA